MREVVITGIGMRTPMGHSLDAVRAVFLSGQPVIRAFEGPNGQMRVGARLVEDVGASFGKSDRLLFDQMAMMAGLASDDCIADSGVALDQIDRDRAGAFVGTGQGAMESKFRTFSAVALKTRCHPFAVLQGLDNGAANLISIRHDLRGAAETSVQACSSSNVAIGNAFRAIRHGYLDIAVAGGADATFTEGGLQAWEAMRVLARFDPAEPQTACRPFSKDRTGLVLGEGAVFYVLESADSARARGARVYARVAGYATSSDAVHISQPDAAGQARCLARVLQDAGLAREDIGYLNCHGTATVAGDPIEAQSIRAAFGTRAEQTPVSATKSLHGHMLGAAGAVELLAAIVAIRDGILAPTANLREADEACDLDFIPNHARSDVRVDAALSTSFAFGGTNACIALARF